MDLSSPDQVSLEHQSEIHCLFNNGQQDANKLKGTKRQNKLAVKTKKQHNQMQCSSFGILAILCHKEIVFIFKERKKKSAPG